MFAAVERRHVLPREHQRRRSPRVQQRGTIGLGHFVRVAGPDDREIGDRPQRGQLLDRLVRGPVLAHADGIVGEDVEHRQAHDGGHADRRPHVIGKDEEGGAEGAQSGQRHAVDDRAHGMLADAEVEISGVVACGLEIAAAVDEREGRRGQVARPAQQPRQPPGDLIQDLAGTGPRGQPLGVGGKGPDLGVPTLGQFAPPDEIEFLGQLGELPDVLGVTSFPRPGGATGRGRRCSRGSGPAPLPARGTSGLPASHRPAW